MASSTPSTVDAAGVQLLLHSWVELQVREGVRFDAPPRRETRQSRAQAERHSGPEAEPALHAALANTGEVVGRRLAQR